MRAYLSAAMVSMAAAVAGCNQPAVALKPLAFQESATTVRDWDRVAHRISFEMVGRRLLPGYGTPPDPERMMFPAFYVYVVQPESTFLHEVAEELQNDILHEGGHVARSPAGASVINLSVDFIKWSPRDKPPGGAFTALGAAAGVGILVGATTPWSHWTGAWDEALLATGAGLLTDTVIALTPTMNAEAIWEASIVSPDRLLFDLREPIYIREGDIPLYSGNVRLAHISSPGPTSTLVARRIRLDP